MLSAGVLVLIGCSSGGASQTVDPQDAGVIKARACTEGDGRSTVLYVQNLDEFGWGDVRIGVSKGGETYQAAEKLCCLPRAENCPTINAVLSRALNELCELAYHMPNAAETVEAPYTAAERLTFLPQPAIVKSWRACRRRIRSRPSHSPNHESSSTMWAGRLSSLEEGLAKGLSGSPTGTTWAASRTLRVSA